MFAFELGRIRRCRGILGDARRGARLELRQRFLQGFRRNLAQAIVQ
jgi:hypothetical protein